MSFLTCWEISQMSHFNFMFICSVRQNTISIFLTWTVRNNYVLNRNVFRQSSNSVIAQTMQSLTIKSITLASANEYICF